MSNFVLIVICLVLGVLARRFKRVPVSFAEALNHFVIYVSLPALTLEHLHGQFTLSPYPVAMAWLLFGGGCAFFVFVARQAGWSRRVLGALILCAGLGNTSFVGYPLIEALYGRQALQTAILTDQPGTFLVLATLGMFVVALLSGRRTSPAALGRKIVTFPPFVAMLVALATGRLAFPPAFAEAVSRLGATLVPLALVSVGFQLRLEKAALRRHAAALSIGLIYKLVLGPALIAALYLGLCGARGEAIQITIAQAAMAPMVTGAIVAAEYGFEPELASLLVGVGIPLSLFTVPAWVWFLRNI